MTKPHYHTRTLDQGIEITVALPGVPTEHLEVNREKQTLKIDAQRLTPGDDFQAHDQEPLTFQLQLNLHQDLDHDAIQAKYKNGLLTLTIPKKSELAPRKIEILPN